MSAEDQVFHAIQLTRLWLKEALCTPEVLVKMTACNVDPEALEEKIAEILEYLDKTQEEAKVKEEKPK